jgi:hypothetical protein
MILIAALAASCAVPETPELPCSLGGNDCPDAAPLCVVWSYTDARCAAPLPLEPGATRVPPELCGTCGQPVAWLGQHYVVCLPDEYAHRCPNE